MDGEVTARLRTGKQLPTKPNQETSFAEGDAFLKSRVRENCKHGSVWGHEGEIPLPTRPRCQRTDMNSGEPRYSQSGSMRQQVLKDEEPQKISRQSDYPVVSMKSTKVDGEKGIAGIRGDIGETSATPRGGEGMATKLMTLTMRAKENPKLRFTSLMHLLNEDFLLECLGQLKQDKAPGIDGVRLKEYEVNKEANIKDLIDRLKSWKYRPQPTRRAYIPKSNRDMRPLGIPTIEDKIVQMGVKKILEAIFEVDFSDVSYGFRPNRNCHHALDVLDKAIMTKPVNVVVDMDIEKFFDTIDHKWLMKCLTQRVADTNLLRLIGRLLNAGIIEEGKFTETDRGTPQGGILSPLLANIYLHYILDLWFERHVRRQLKGYACLIRYADDFVVLFQNDDEAKAFGDMLRQRLDKFGLKIAKDKSRIIGFGRRAWHKAEQTGGKVSTFDFLGFTHYCDKTRHGKFKLGRKTASLKFRQKMKATNLWLKSVRNLVELKEWWQILRRKLIGHYNYYGISGNMSQITKFYRRNLSLAYKWINRRSQKRSYNWEQFCRFLKYNPLPRPKIYHLTYTLSSY
jgi:RNA-directed DNA polymerase